MLNAEKIRTIDLGLRAKFVKLTYTFSKMTRNSTHDETGNVLAPRHERASAKRKALRP
ncbi:hypothetical protein D3C87_2043920 [compost metagenome]